MTTILQSLLLVAALLLVGSSSALAQKKIVLVAGAQSHGPGDHEFRAGSLLLQKCLAGVQGVQAVVYSNGWPDDPKAFEGAAAVLFYMDGGANHPVVKGDRPQQIDELAKKGVGLGFAHYAVEVVTNKGGAELTRWIGGHYEHGFSVNPMWSPDFKALPNHPIARGVKPFSIRDEWYFNMRFRPEMKGITPILLAMPSDEVRKGPYVHPKGPYDHIVAASGRDEIMMWAVEREDGGRGFGFTGGHRHVNWGDENFRKIMLNALLWLAKIEVPAEGVQSIVTAEDLKQNLDPKQKK
jgi:type 1 glutamine amidotransferase